ncbi:ImpB/MucB/SamB family protein, partial [Oenococcus oeni]
MRRLIITPVAALLRTCLVSFKNYLQEGQYNHLKTAVKGT